jgi:hypothetical protein
VDNNPIDSLWAGMAGTLGPYAPRAAAALLILLAAWLGARLVRTAITRLADKRGLDEKLSSPGLAALLAQIAGGIVWLLALPALLGTLGLQGLLDPVNAMMSRLLGFAPSVLGALIVFGIGFIVARIAGQIVAGLLRAAGSESAAERMGLTRSLGDGGLAGLVGRVVQALILLPTLVAALQPLQLDAVTQPLSRMLEQVISLIPRLASAAIVLAVAAVIGRALSGITSAALGAMGLNRLPQRIGLGDSLSLGGRDLSELAGSLVMAAVMLVAAMQAFEVIGLPLLAQLIAQLGNVLANVAVALVVLGVGVWLGTLAAQAIRASQVANAGVLAHLARAAILFFAAALALRQAGLPAEIVAIAFGAVVGSIAIGLGVAIGVGGRHVAARLLDAAASSFDRERPDVVAAPPAEPQRKD